jgi:hypothetical protein
LGGGGTWEKARAAALAGHSSAVAASARVSTTPPTSSLGSGRYFRMAASDLASRARGCSSGAAISCEECGG